LKEIFIKNSTINITVCNNVKAQSFGSLGAVCGVKAVQFWSFKNNLLAYTSTAASDPKLCAASNNFCIINCYKVTDHN